MNKLRLFLTGCLMCIALMMLIGCLPGDALASEYNDTTAATTTYDESSGKNYCGELGYLPPNPNLSDAENRGRCTWYLYTAGNENFYRTLYLKTGGGFVDLLQFLDTRKHDQRFDNYGVMNDPGCESATEPDKYGLWLDKCKDSKSSGVVGFRKYDNPKFVPAAWDAQKYYQDPTKIEPPYLIGASCAVCHVSFNPLKPPQEKEHPNWENLLPTVGNQYLEEGKLFAASLKPDNFVWQVINAQQAGTSDTSRIATDHINNPNIINSIYNLAFRPTHEEVMEDGSKQQVYHILKDGADSIGALGALKRVYINIGSCSDYWLTLHEPLYGRTPQKPFDVETAKKVCPDWNKTEELMPEMGGFLMTQTPPLLKDAPGGAALISKDDAVMKRGKEVFAASCAQCHSSKQPTAEIAADPEQARKWYQESVLSSDFSDQNFLSDDQRYPVSLIGTNAGRALATNAIKGHIWQEFSSKTYKQLPSVGTLTFENPFDKSEPIEFKAPATGQGYYRTPSLAGIWATAPYLHNNSVGKYTKDPSVQARVDAYTDAMEKLLYPEKRDHTISRTTQDSTLELIKGIKVPVPKGTPINILANINIRDALTELNLKELFKDLKPEGGLKGKFERILISLNRSPDFVEDGGHTFGSELSDTDKSALIEFVKTL